MPAFHAAPGSAWIWIGPLDLRLFLEPAQRVGVEPGDHLAPLELGDQVAVFRCRPDGLDAERDERILDVERASGEVVSRASEHGAKDLLALGVDRVVGGQHDHDLVDGPVDGERREGDGRGGVPGVWLGQHRDPGELILDVADVALVGDDRDVLGPQVELVTVHEAGDGQLEERVAPKQGEERLGAFGPAEGMQPGPTAAGQDDGVHVTLIVSGLAASSGVSRASRPRRRRRRIFLEAARSDVHDRPASRPRRRRPRRW